MLPTFNPVRYIVRNVIVLNESLTAARVNYTVQPCFVSLRNVAGSTVTLVVTYSETDSLKVIGMQVYDLVISENLK